MAIAVTVLTKDVYLFQKIKLALGQEFEVSDKITPDTKKILVDTDNSSLPDRAGCITMSRIQACTDIRIPFSPSAVRDILTESASDSPLLSLSESERCALLRDKKIKLTEAEYSLLRVLLSNKGKFIPREKILETVWGEGFDRGVVTVYIHYLREKLEADGDKIILSSHKQGYKIDERFIGGCDA